MPETSIHCYMFNTLYIHYVHADNMYLYGYLPSDEHLMLTPIQCVY